MIGTVVTTFDAPAIPLAAAPPAPAASGLTPAGLPYPTMDDHPAQTAKYIGDLADAVTTRLANPGVVFAFGKVQCDGNGDAIMAFSALSRLDGIVPQAVITTTALYFIFPIVRSRAGNQATVRFRSGPINTPNAIIVPYAGELNVAAYAWGIPA